MFLKVFWFNAGKRRVRVGVGREDHGWGQLHPAWDCHRLLVRAGIETRDTSS